MSRVTEKWKGICAIISLAIAVFFTPILLSQYLIGDDFIVPPPNSIPLPDPDLEGKLSLTDALQYTAISNDLQSYQMNMSELSRLLWSMQGITNEWGLRAAPSAGGTYPLEIYLYITDSISIPLGAHRYLPVGHLLDPIPYSSAIKVVDAFTGLERSSIENTSLLLIVTANYSRTTERYGDRGVQYVHLETGHVLQNCLLELASLGLATRPATAFNSATLQSFLNTSLVPLLALPIGLHGNTPDTGVILQTSEMTVEQTISLRRSQREYLTGYLSGSVIEIVAGNLSLVSAFCEFDRVDVKIAARNVTDYDSGLYSYSFSGSELSLIELGDLSEDLYVAGLNQPWIRDAQANVVLSCDQSWALSQVSPELRWRELLYSMGMLAQTVYLKCTAMSLGTISIGAFYENLVIDVVDVSSGYLPVYIMPIGLV